MDWCSVSLTPQGLPKYIYLSPPLIFPTTCNGIRTKNRPVWINPGAAPIRWMGPIRNPRWEQKRTEGYSFWEQKRTEGYSFKLIFKLIDICLQCSKVISTCCLGCIWLTALRRAQKNAFSIQSCRFRYAPYTSVNAHVWSVAGTTTLDREWEKWCKQAF